MNLELKNLVLLPDLVLGAIARVPAPVVHNISKAIAIKMVFWHLALDGVEGCYVEFGVASGNSMRSAERAEKLTRSTSLGVKRIPRRLYGFDTFSGFSSSSDADSHPTWDGDRFSVAIDRVRHRFRKAAERVTLVAVDANHLASESGPSLDLNECIPCNNIAIAVMDMDLGAPTLAALNWVEPKLSSGSCIFFDEFFAYAGDPERGEAGAWQAFLSQHPDISARHFKTYGDGGVVFQIQRTPQ